MNDGEKLEELKNIIIAHVKEEIIPDLNEKFDLLREYLLLSPVKEQLPDYILNCSNIDECWEYINNTKNTLSGKIALVEGTFPALIITNKQLNPKKKKSTYKRKNKTVICETSKNKIFIVHGHDNELKQEVARFCQKIGFDPVILHEQGNSGNTIIEKLEKNSDVEFAIILYTPCDSGKANKSKSRNKPRARQNVVFEHGLFMGILGRENVIALVKDNVELPNDISGIAFIDVDKSGAWKTRIAQDLQDAGSNFDTKKLLNN